MSDITEHPVFIKINDLLVKLERLATVVEGMEIRQNAYEKKVDTNVTMLAVLKTKMTILASIPGFIMGFIGVIISILKKKG